jgi:DNA invertase Pin-like site-specific DNA recombinase
MTNNQASSQAVLFLRTRQLGSSMSNRQGEQRQLAAGRNVCHQAAGQLGLVVIREYLERGDTGPIWRRPTLRLMFEELRTLHDAAYIIAARPDHLTRILADRRTVELELAATGVTLIVASQLPATRLEEITV